MAVVILETVAVIWHSLTFTWAHPNVSVSWALTDFAVTSFSQGLVTTGMPKILMKWKDFSSSFCDQVVYSKKDTGGTYLAQSEGLQCCIFCLKFHFPFCLEVNGIYQDQLGGVCHISWTQQILDFAFWNHKSQISFQHSANILISFSLSSAS